MKGNRDLKRWVPALDRSPGTCVISFFCPDGLQGPGSPVQATGGEAALPGAQSHSWRSSTSPAAASKTHAHKPLSCLAVPRATGTEPPG